MCFHSSNWDLIGINLSYFPILFSQKRYSLQAGPPKRVPRSKGVNPTAVQALLKKQFHDSKKKGNDPQIKVKT